MNYAGRRVFRICIVLLLFALFTAAKNYLPFILRPFFMEIDQEDAVLVFRLIATIRWIILAVLFSEIINLVYDIRNRKTNNSSIKPKLVKDLIVIFIFFATGVIILTRVFNQPLTGVWLTSGALALTLGLALRNIILDLFSGLAVNIEKPYRIGDWVEIHQRFSAESFSCKKHKTTIKEFSRILWKSVKIRVHAISGSICLQQEISI